MNANLNALSFPVLRFSQRLIFPARDLADVVHCTATALKSGFFSNQLIVDSSGNAVRLKGARKLRGVGPFKGYNLLLGQKIEVEVVLDGDFFKIDIEDLRARVLKIIRGAEWSASEDNDEVLQAVAEANSISELVRAVSDAYYSK